MLRYVEDSPPVKVVHVRHDSRRRPGESSPVFLPDDLEQFTDCILPPRRYVLHGLSAATIESISRTVREEYECNNLQLPVIELHSSSHRIR